jgi:hypothetical protein
VLEKGSSVWGGFWYLGSGLGYWRERQCLERVTGNHRKPRCCGGMLVYPGCQRTKSFLSMREHIERLREKKSMRRAPHDHQR